MDDFQKYRMLIITAGVILVLFLAGVGLYDTWQAYQVGNLTINAPQQNVAFSVSGDANTFSGTTTLYYLKKGTYTVHAYGLLSGDFLAKDYQVDVSGNKTVNLNISLPIDPNGYNQGGLEGP